MKDYIEREAACELLAMALDDDWEPEYAANRMNEIPAADVRPVVRGKWERTDAYPHRLYCSICYKTYLKNDELLERWEFPLNFCPNCGADMRGEN